LTSALRLMNWFIRESSVAAIPLTPCLEHAWPAFVRAYSYAFFPDRR
jgi:hypothetical protein